MSPRKRHGNLEKVVSDVGPEKSQHAREDSKSTHVKQSVHAGRASQVMWSIKLPLGQQNETSTSGAQK